MKTNFRFSVAIILAIASVSIGCQSTTSFFMQRLENDRVTANSNGELGVHQDAKPFKGIPVSLKVATHVDVKIYETIYLDKKNFEQIQTDRRNLHASATPVYSDKIFSVDPKRAAAGNTDYEFDFNSSHQDQRQRQYFKKITQKITDETIQDLTSALDGILPLLRPGASAQAQSGSTESSLTGPSSPVLPKQRVVAWKRFDIHHPDFENQVKDFVGAHMNDCRSCNRDSGFSIR